MKQIPCIILLLLLSTALSAQVDMGLVRLQVDEQFLQAATVTDTGTQSDRTTYLDDGHLHYSGRDGGKQYASSLNANLELQKEEGSWFTRGGSVYGMLNETYSKSLGMENTVGEDNWDWHIAPSLRFRYRNDKDDNVFYATGYGRPASASNMQPVLNIADPARLSLGNVCLKPYAQTRVSIEWTRREPEKE